IKGMHLTDLNLEECDISELDLTGCHLTKCNLRKIEGAATLATTASLAGSDLRGLSFTSLDLTSVDLKGADLTECTLHRTQFTRDLVMGAKFSMCMDVQWQKEFGDMVSGGAVELKGKRCIRIGDTTVGCRPGEAARVHLSVHCKDDSGKLMIEQELLNPSE
ncbi:hypothetical protein KIPB_011277, partial [Kipferlia bialata]